MRTEVLVVNGPCGCQQSPQDDDDVIRNADLADGFVDGPAPHIPHTYLQNALGKPR
jgi:hypothetical protein